MGHATSLPVTSISNLAILGWKGLRFRGGCQWSGNYWWWLKDPYIPRRILTFQPVNLPTFHSGGKLYHQWLTDYASRLEAQNLAFVRFNQPRLRADVYQGVVDVALDSDSVHPSGGSNLAFVGRRIILPSSFVGSPRYHQALFQDNMALVRQYGKPDLFITFTCNPGWDEIVEVLQVHGHGRPSYWRPDLVVRVFRQKVELFMNLMVDPTNCMFGDIIGFTYVVEFQKRGLPHIHVLLMLENKPSPDMVDRFVMAELPNPDTHPRLFFLVVTSMIHGPCGSLRPAASCMREAREPGKPLECRFGYPKAYHEAQQWCETGYPLYQRRAPDIEGSSTAAFAALPLRVLFGPKAGRHQSGIMFKISVDGRCVWLHHRRLVENVDARCFGEAELSRLGCDPSSRDINQYRRITNADVVPFNPTLLLMFHGHINVELCSSVSAVKYLYKYIHKGDDRLVFGLHWPEESVPDSHVEEAPRNSAEPPQRSGGRSQGSSAIDGGPEGSMKIMGHHDGIQRGIDSGGRAESCEKDEIAEYLDGRYLSVTESCWRIFGFPFHESKPPVQRLTVHLPRQQTVVFPEKCEAGSTIESFDTQKSTLLAWFQLNQDDCYARQFYYYEIPQYYTWCSSLRKWKRRKNATRYPVIGRMVFVRVNEVERFHLRVLLCHPHSKGARSFDHLLTVNGTHLQTFVEVCAALGILQDDKHLHETLDEAASSYMPSSLRVLFVTILLFSNPDSPRALWDKHAMSLCEDYFLRNCQHLGVPPVTGEVSDEELLSMAFASGMLHGFEGPRALALPLLKQRRDRAFKRSRHQALQDIDDMLREQGKSLEAFGFGLEQPHPFFLPHVLERDVYNPVDEKERFESLFQTLHPEQKDVFAEIVKALDALQPLDLPQLPPRVHYRKCMIVSPQWLGPTCFFVDGPGGSGKTYLYETLLSYVRSKGQVAVAVASSGLAATLLSGGRTAHSTFHIPLQLHEQSVCKVSQQSDKASLLRQTSLIVWDEAPMLHRHAFEAVDRLLRDLSKMERDVFGRKCVVLGGDFRQLLPVVKYGGRADIVNASLCFSQLWSHPALRILHLRVNQRVFQLPLAEQPYSESEQRELPGAAAHSEPGVVPVSGMSDDRKTFAEFLMSVGNGTTTGCARGAACGVTEHPPQDVSGGEWVSLPQQIVYKVDSSCWEEGQDRLIEFVFPGLAQRFAEPAYDLCSRVIVAPRNDDVRGINDITLHKER